MVLSFGMGVGDEDFGSRSLDSLIPGDRDAPDSPYKRVKNWVLLRGKRMWVATALLLGVLFVLLSMSIIRPWNLQELLENTSTVQTLFSSLLSGSILLVSIVVSINSIVLSEEITDIESQRERIDASIRYRGQIEEFIESDVSPARPAEFLRTILKVIDHQANGIDRIAEEGDNDQFAEEAETFSEEVTREAERAGKTLSGAKFGTFKVLLAGLNYDYSWQLHVARRFKRKYGHCLNDEQQEAIDDLVETLKVFATGREYFKSLYYKREFARLSARLLYVALPTIVYISYVMLAIHSPEFLPTEELWLVSREISMAPLTLFVGLSYTIALAPYVVLTSYVLRAMSVTLRTLASGPFVLRSGTELDEFDWDEEIEVSETSLPTPGGGEDGEESEDEETVEENPVEEEEAEESTEEKPAEVESTEEKPAGDD